MNENQQLAAAVSKITGDDADHVEAVVREHQNKYPGSWQEWNLEAKTATVSKIMQKAQKMREGAPARIVQYCS